MNTEQNSQGLTSNRKEKVDMYLKTVKPYNAPKKLYGGFWIRLGAFIIDRLFIALITSIILDLSVYRFLGTGIEMSFGITVFKLVIFVGYFFLTTLLLDGRTPGKIICCLRVISLKENTLSKRTLIFRELLGKVVFFYAPWIAIILVFSFKRQHLIDMLADTTVLNEKKIDELAQCASLFL